MRIVRRLAPLQSRPTSPNLAQSRRTSADDRRTPLGVRGRREDALQRRTSTPDFIVDGFGAGGEAAGEAAQAAGGAVGAEASASGLR